MKHDYEEAVRHHTDETDIEEEADDDGKQPWEIEFEEGERLALEEQTKDEIDWDAD